MDDFIERLKNWKTTLIGVITFILVVLVSTGVIGVEAKDYITQNLNGFWEGLVAIMTTISSIVLILSKYPKE